MKPQLLALADAPPRPWRNGGGTTRELLAGPPGASAWQWRISVAEIAADGPFSAFPGVVRWFAVLEGEGVELSFAASAGGAVPATLRLTPADAPLRFDGASAPGCRLIGGPTRDLNLMLQGVPGRMERAQAGRAWSPRSARAGLYAIGAGPVVEEGGRAHAVAAHTLLWFDAAPPSLAWESAAPACWLAVGATG